MTPTRWLIVLFWVLVTALLLRECMRETAEKSREGDTGKPRQYFFVPPINVPKPALAPALPATGANVRQMTFTTKLNTPGTGSFTCYMTVRNEGISAATNIRARIRPYRGVGYGSIDTGPKRFHILKENDPLSQYGAWVSFPDLKPGESSTESAVFFDHPNVTAGYNSNPEINFENAK